MPLPQSQTPALSSHSQSSDWDDLSSSADDMKLMVLAAGEGGILLVRSQIPNNQKIHAFQHLGMKNALSIHDNEFLIKLAQEKTVISKLQT